MNARMTTEMAALTTTEMSSGMNIDLTAITTTKMDTSMTYRNRCNNN
jgi:hypothetical protein